jgi:hypothetical protein
MIVPKANRVRSEIKPKVAVAVAVAVAVLHAPEQRKLDREASRAPKRMAIVLLEKELA